MYLPIEILKEVGSYLSLSDKNACIRVCYDWYEPFLHLLYTRIIIRSRHQFRLFYQTIQQSANIREPLGYFVKELFFEHSDNNRRHPVGLTRDELESFPKYFKNLQVLDFDPKLWQYMRYSDIFAQMKCIQQLPTFNRNIIFQPFLEKNINVDLISQLTYLSISGEATEYLAQNNLITSVWSRMPKLEHLIIRGANYTQLNIKMIIALGAQLPQLKHLTLGCITLPLDENDMCSTTRFPLFTSALSLTLDDVHLQNWRLITFLSLAFYHIEMLDFDVTFDWFYNDNVTIDLYEQSMDACMGFAQLCLYLKKIRFRRVNTSVFPFPYDAFFHEIADIHSDLVKVEMIDYAWWSTINPSSSFKAATVQTGLLSKADLKFSWTGKKTDMALFKNLRSCPNLTKLDLDCDIPLKNGLRLDLLLDNCQALEALSLSHTLITIGKPIEKASENRHGIKSLKFEESVLGNHLMDYISRSCIKLDKLWITKCVQEKPRRSAFIVISMPEHNFKSIRLNSLHLNPGGSNGKCEASIAILSFYESTRYESQTERKKKSETKDIYKKNNGMPVAAPEMWRFYHVHKSESTNTNSKQLRRLSTEEAVRIANFEMNEKKWKAIKNAPRRKSFTDKQLWEKDIQFGAVLLLCKSVDHLRFNELTV
ncbi:uncharacterized protein BX663DRAFT_500854 [Cokeromyces recurvatus]|uniref:uncharacterized protein n=1 Tax=Cokeromyces recurvatus TaxID=90255 RepID=UPI00221EC253|nr:uncharacterized protein BX663DRAFT_500854 [Cokeromyces recurvatus]KAI7905773.1 hypothetical protein BX663DRAFT_500854 [Cokeromyces recurvatus]